MWFDFHLKAIILHLQAMVRFIYTLSDSTKSCSICIYRYVYYHLEIIT